MFSYSRLVNSLRFILSKFGKNYNVVNEGTLVEPAVYVCRHMNMHGPWISLSRIKLIFHPWILSTLCNKKDCYRHYVEYTFTKRFHIPCILSKIIAKPSAIFVEKLCKGLQAIPVYRDKNSFKTFIRSRNILLKDENIIIFPDVDYKNKGDVGELYKGFLLIEKFYYHKLHKHVPFVPINIEENIISIGNPIYFNNYIDNEMFKSECDNVINKILQSI